MEDDQVSRSTSDSIDREAIQKDEEFEDEDEDEDEQEQEQEREQESSVPTETNKKKYKTLLEFNRRLEDAILSNNLVGEKYKANENLKDIELWGVPLLPSRGNERTDVVLMKFLKAKDFDVPDALEMLRNAIMWRQDFNVDNLFDEKPGPDHDSIGYIDGMDKAGHPLCYQSYEVFKDKEILSKRYGTKESRDAFLRWRIQFLEQCIRKLDFKPGGADSVVQIIDVKNISRQLLSEIIPGSKKYLSILQDNYPGIIYRTVIVNIPTWFFAFYTLQMRLMTKRYKFKVTYAKSSGVTETLLRFIDPQNIPAQYGGLRRQGGVFTPDDKVLEQNLKGYATEQIEIPITEVGMTIYWDISVVGTEVNYKEEFVPEDEGSYTVLLQKGKQIGKMTTGSFHIRESGKILITFQNPISKSRKVFYRYKLISTPPMYTSSKKPLDLDKND